MEGRSGFVTKKTRGKLTAVITFLAVIIYAVFFLSDDALEPELAVDGQLTVTFIDIGQGDSELIQQGGNALLIDSGEYSKREELIV
ncbi:MAG: hypothetical protein LBS84_04025, partial [Clostridiales bacterium]|nr:hypothetical protein [Clostridiales bacterium]